MAYSFLGWEPALRREKYSVTLAGQTVVEVMSQFGKVSSARHEIRITAGDVPTYIVYAQPKSGSPSVIEVWCSDDAVSDDAVSDEVLIFADGE